MKKRYSIEVDHTPSCECGEYHWIIWEYNYADAKVERSKAELRPWSAGSLTCGGVTCVCGNCGRTSGMCGHEPTKLHAIASALEASEKLKEK